MNAYIKPNVDIQLTQMTPEHASKLLAINTKNRKINKTKVAQYSRDMINGNFMFNGNSICVSDTNILIDGQQRLTACVESGIPFWTLLIKNLSEKAMVTIDSGRSRTYSDRLKIRGYENYTGLAATITHLALIANKHPKHHGFTPSQMDGVLEKHGAVIDSVKFAARTFTRCDPLLGAIHYIAKQTGYDDKADDFIKTWKDGQMNYDDDPVHYIRELISRDAMRQKKMTTVHKMRLIMLSWNKFKCSEPLKSAKVSKHAYEMDGWDHKTCNLVM